MGVHSSEKQITAIRFSNAFQESPEMTGPAAEDFRRTIWI